MVKAKKAAITHDISIAFPGTTLNLHINTSAVTIGNNAGIIKYVIAFPFFMRLIFA